MKYLQSTGSLSLPSRLPLTLWALIPWHLCISMDLTLLLLPLAPLKCMLRHWKMSPYLQLLWIFLLHFGHASWPRKVLFTLSPMKIVLLKLDNVGGPASTCCLTESWLSWVKAIFFSLTFKPLLPIVTSGSFSSWLQNPQVLYNHPSPPPCYY